MLIQKAKILQESTTLPGSRKPEPPKKRKHTTNQAHKKEKKDTSC
jgi:hypothetical protein